MKMKKGLLMTALITGTVMSSAVAFAEELQEYSLDQMGHWSKFWGWAVT
ncbi:hypothetical protein [Phascolarctobacterium succinatutens]